MTTISRLSNDKWALLACAALVGLGAAPIAFSWPAMPTAAFFSDLPRLQILGYILLALVTGSVIAAAAWLDPERGTGKIVRITGFVLIAALLTDTHYYSRDIYKIEWQIDQYNAVFAHTCPAPDQYRFLPQGVLWWMMLCNGDFGISYLAYRFLFTFLVCLSLYHFGRNYLPPRDAILAVFVYALFYPLSTRYYFGNMVDPLSHAIMIAALTYCRRQKFACVLCLMVAGTCVKETMLVIAPCYWLMSLGRPKQSASRDSMAVVGLVAAGAVAFFACRIPFHFNFSFHALNRTPELMIYSNLGMSGARAHSEVSVFQRYLHPILFIFMWLPLTIIRRRQLPASLFYTALYLSTAIYLTNLCFSWNYESRNFVPALVVLIVCTLVIINATLEREAWNCVTDSRDSRAPCAMQVGVDADPPGNDLR